ncbi:NB-ARC domain-containing protein [Acrocarpospora sp. B8E8]|uniref:NB-ARC domain-containing protein n=1 Tax=Acrocarpospora sp. B8E8 TaxID=3153572 RepID=UPI00325FAEEB
MDGTVHGAVVQARDVGGGVHVHQAPTPQPVPRQLPAVGALVNRHDTLVLLNRLRAVSNRAGSPVVVVVSGPPGIGKTALSLNWAHRNRAHFPDGQLYANLRGHALGAPAETVEVLRWFIRSFGIPGDRIPGGLAERAALYQSLVTERRVVVVLDDAISAAQVRPLLPASGDGVVLVTSRRRLAGLVLDGGHRVQVSPLDSAAAMDLLQARVGEDRVGQELAAAAELVKLCRCNPLALSIAAARDGPWPRWSSPSRTKRDGFPNCPWRTTCRFDPP